jgi:hypothetical protein
MLDPKKWKSNAGVTTIPIKLLSTALQTDDATLPPAAEVNMTHIFTVVGKHDRISKPSSKGFGKAFGRSHVHAFVSGIPTKNGQTPKVQKLIIPSTER